MFDWIRFVVLGKILLDMKTEESIRAAISRFYYGIFGVLRRYLINVKHKYVLMSRGGNVHESVFRELSKSKDLTESEISSIFNKLRVMRNHADYDAEFDYGYFMEFLVDYKKELKTIFDSMTYFISDPNY